MYSGREVSIVVARHKRAASSQGDYLYVVVFAIAATNKGLDGRVAFDTVFLAQGLLNRAVNIADQNCGGAGKRVAELVPSRFHGFTVASPFDR